MAHCNNADIVPDIEWQTDIDSILKGFRASLYFEIPLKKKDYAMKFHPYLKTDKTTKYTVSDNENVARDISHQSASCTKCEHADVSGIVSSV